MASHHLTRNFLRLLAAGHRDPGDLVPIVMSHLFDLCPTCHEEFEAWRHEVRQGESEDYTSAFDRAQRRILAASDRAEEELQTAQPRLEELLQMDKTEQVTALRQSDGRFQGPSLGNLLIEACRDKLPGFPEESLALARLARTVLEHSEVSTLSIEIYARATAYVANARRVFGRLPEADEIFSQARFFLRQAGGGDRALVAEMDNLEGLLRMDRREHGEALDLLRRALMAFEMEQDWVTAMRAAINLGLVHREMGNPLDGIQTLESRLEDFGSHVDDRLLLFAHHLLALCLCDAGLFLQAEEVLEANRVSYERFGDPLSLLRLSWLEGKIARGLGRVEVAESFLKSAQDGFRSREFAYDTALVSLDLASMYLQQGKVREVQTLAVEMVEVFQRLEVHREALAALMLFEDAAKLQQVTLSWVESLSRYLMQAQRDPNLTFQAAS